MIVTQNHPRLVRFFAVLILIEIGFLTYVIRGHRRTLEPTEALAAQVVPLTVTVAALIETDGIVHTYSGHGVFISAEGHVLTCAHIVKHEGMTGVLVTNENGVMCRGEIIYVDPRRDLAIIGTNFYDVAYARIADPRTVAVGQELLIVGSPLGFTFSVTHGIVSAMYRDFPSAYNTTQTDAMVAPGNSGGPAFNIRGEVVGIVSFYVPLSMEVPNNPGLSFMVSAAQIRECLTRFKGLGKIR